MLLSEWLAKGQSLLSAGRRAARLPESQMRAARTRVVNEYDSAPRDAKITKRSPNELRPKNTIQDGIRRNGPLQAVNNLPLDIGPSRYVVFGRRSPASTIWMSARTLDSLTRRMEMERSPRRPTKLR